MVLLELLTGRVAHNLELHEIGLGVPDQLRSTLGNRVHCRVGTREKACVRGAGIADPLRERSRPLQSDLALSQGDDVLALLSGEKVLDLEHFRLI